MASALARERCVRAQLVHERTGVATRGIVAAPHRAGRIGAAARLSLVLAADGSEHDDLRPGTAHQALAAAPGPLVRVTSLAMASPQV